MITNQVILLSAFVLLNLIHHSVETKYEFELEDEDIFSACVDNPQEFSPIHKLFNLSEFKTEVCEDGINVSGNISFVSDIQATNRVEASTSFFRFDRGNWIQTGLNIKYEDFCASFMDKKQYFYDLWTKHIINHEEMKTSCPSPRVKGILKTFVCKPQLSLGVPLNPGRYKYRILFAILDKNNQIRGKKICTEVLVYLYKLST
ncbi:hypothetical protein KR018_007570 [Drosophila ironensis]|nr:hypothetical protein KR018_007570 [Drosophila ironensis]